MSRGRLLRWLPEAYDDLRDARDWYDEQNPGLGAELIAEFWRTVNAVAHSPTTPRTVELPESDEVIRRGHFDGWPYSIVYLVEDEIVIIAVHHDRRHPRAWHSRLK